MTHHLHLHKNDWISLDVMLVLAEPGDIVEIRRWMGRNHFALYLGNGQVAHIGIRKERGKKRVVIFKSSLAILAKGYLVRVNNRWVETWKRDLKARRTAENFIVNFLAPITGNTWTYYTGFMQQIIELNKTHLRHLNHWIHHNALLELPKPGYIIEIRRLMGYNHFALHLGNEQVAHVESRKERGKFRGVIGKSSVADVAKGRLIRLNELWGETWKRGLTARPTAEQVIVNFLTAVTGNMWIHDGTTFIQQITEVTHQRHLHLRKKDWIRPDALMVLAIPGDIIQIERKVYSHFAMYLGDGQVAHVKIRMAGAEKRGDIIQSSLAKAAKRCFVRVNNLEDEAWTLGLTARPAEVVIANARAAVGTTIAYNVIMNNCEHVVTRFKYGDDGFSYQTGLYLFE